MAIPRQVSGGSPAKPPLTIKDDNTFNPFLDDEQSGENLARPDSLRTHDKDDTFHEDRLPAAAEIIPKSAIINLGDDDLDELLGINEISESIALPEVSQMPETLPNIDSIALTEHTPVEFSESSLKEDTSNVLPLDVIDVIDVIDVTFREDSLDDTRVLVADEFDTNSLDGLATQSGENSEKGIDELVDINELLAGLEGDSPENTRELVHNLGVRDSIEFDDGSYGNSDNSDYADNISSNDDISDLIQFDDEDDDNDDDEEGAFSYEPLDSDDSSTHVDSSPVMFADTRDDDDDEDDEWGFETIPDETIPDEPFNPFSNFSDFEEDSSTPDALGSQGNSQTPQNESESAAGGPGSDSGDVGRGNAFEAVREPHSASDDSSLGFAGKFIKSIKSKFAVIQAQVSADAKGETIPTKESLLGDIPDYAKPIRDDEFDKVDEIEEVPKGKEGRPAGKKPKGKSAFSKLFAPLKSGYTFVVNLIFGVISGVLKVLSAIPVIGRLFKPLLAATNILKKIALYLPIVFVIGGMVVASYLAVPNSSMVELPDEGSAFMNEFSYNEGKVSGMAHNTGETIVDVSANFTVFTIQPSINPLSWFIPKEASTCSSKVVEIDIDGKKKVASTCKDVKGFIPRVSGVLE